MEVPRELTARRIPSDRRCRRCGRAAPGARGGAPAGPWGTLSTGTRPPCVGLSWRSASFSVIHLDTMFKIDVFIPTGRPFDDAQLERRAAHDREQSRAVGLRRLRGRHDPREARRVPRGRRRLRTAVARHPRHRSSAIGDPGFESTSGRWPSRSA